MTEESTKNKIGKSKSSNEIVTVESIVGEQIADAIERGLAYFGTDAIVESLLYILELDYSVDLKSVAFNPNVLRNALLKMFGAAEYVVESKICQVIGKQLGIDSEGKSFEDLIAIAKARAEEEIPPKK